MVQQLLSSAFRNISDGSLRQPVLEVGIDPTIGELLLPLGAVGDENIVGKAAIAGMAELNWDKMVGDKFLEIMFCCYGFINGCACHHINVAEAGEVVNKDAG